VKLTVYLHLVPGLRIPGKIPPSTLRLHGVMLNRILEKLYEVHIIGVYYYYYYYILTSWSGILHTIKRRKANWIGHILGRNCLLKHVIEGKLEGRIEMTGRRGRRRQ
jgi:hypothetical protein